MIIGHQKQWRFLKQSAELDKLSHAYLFSGQEKLGKRKIALEWISSIFGENLGSRVSLQRDEAGDERKFIDLKIHPDFCLIQPEKKEIQISQIRDLIWRLSLRPFSAPFKAAIIDEAHLMNQEAQNCFLKTLEEPKGKTLLILITEMPERLFPTILSRTQTIKFYPVKKIEIENYLKNQGIEEKRAKELAVISLGRPGVAVDFATQPNQLEKQRALIEELINLSNSDLFFRFQYAKELSKDSQSLKVALDTWLRYFRDNLISTLNQQSPQYPLSKSKNILQRLQITNYLISTTNVNPRLALEILMLEL